MEDRIKQLERRIAELEAKSGEHVRQSDIFPQTIKARHLADEVLADYATLTGNNTFTGTNTFSTLKYGSATGDLFYRASTGILTALGIGSTGQYLKVAAGLPSWATLTVLSSVFIGNTTYDISTTGSLAVTGVGFTPKIVMLMGTVGNGASEAFSIGFMTTSAQITINQDTAGLSYKDTATVGVFWTNSGTQNGYLSYASMDADGFTVTKAKNSTPTGTVNLLYACIG